MKHRTFLLLVLFISWFSIAVAQDTKENADFKLAVNLYNDKLYDLALEQFRQFVASYPNTQQGIEARFYFGLCQTKLGKFDDARLTFQNFALAFPEHPKAPDAWWNVADSYVSLKNLREAALAFERVKTFHPKSKIAPSALVQSSEYFDLAGDPESSRKVLRTLIQDYSSSDLLLPARLKLAVMYLSDNQFELARAESKRVADASKDAGLSGRALILLSRALVGLNRSDEAQRSLDEVTKNYRSTSSYYSALLLLGSLQREMGNANQAFASWKVIEADSAKAPQEIRQQALVETGDLNALRSDQANALRCYTKGAAISGPLQVTALLKAGLAAEQRGDITKALAFLRQAISDSLARMQRGELLLAAARVAGKAENHLEAVKWYGLFRETFPTDKRIPEVYLEEAKLFRDHLHDYQQAIARYETIVNSYPASAIVDDALFGRAEALRLSGALEKALDSYEDLQRRYPASDFAGPARDAALRLRTFEVKDKESGLEKLALLVGDVIAQKSKGELAFRLAEIYFHDLKDYPKAAAQYASALQLGLLPEKQGSALYNEAKAFEYAGSVEASPRIELLLQALVVYDSLLKRFPSGDIADDAVTSQLKVRLALAAGAPDIRKVSGEFLQAHPVLKRKDLVYYFIAEAFRKKRSPEDAVQAYRSATGERPLKDIDGNITFRLGEALSIMGERDSATAVFRDYLRKYPAHEFGAQAVWALAQYESSRGNGKSALDLYNQLEQSFYYTSFMVQLPRARAEASFQGGDFARAAEQYQLLMKNSGASFGPPVPIGLEVYFNLATSYAKIGKRMEAKRSYALYLLKDDTSGRAGQVYSALATLAKEDNDVALATQYLQKASQYSKAGATGMNEATFEAAELYFANEEYANAVSRYNEIVEKGVSDSLKPYILSRVIVCYFRLNNTKEAEARVSSFLKSYQKQERYFAEYEYERGMYFLRKDDYTAAKKFFDNVIQNYATTPFVASAMYGNARVAELSNKQPDATKLYEAILQRFPGDAITPRARLALGNLYYSQEQWDSAARQYKAVLDSESRATDLIPFAMNNLILAYKQLSLFDAALDLTRKYIDRFPDDPELMNKRIDIGVLYQRLGYYDQSVFHLQSLLQNADSDLEAEVRYYIGEAFFYKGDYQQAILEFLKVPYLVTKKTKADWTATSYYMAGQSYEKMSKFDQAITMYKQIIARPGIDATFKTGAQREIDRVNALLKANK
jgi:tetratricopeptide (TPR) repeat protein